MANTHTTLTALFTDVANAIRSKTGKTGSLVADNFPSAISEIQTPNLQAKTVSPSTSSQTVKPDSNYNGLSQVTVNAMATATQATPSISVNGSGLITASATQTAGYVTAGTKSTTKQLTTQAAKTVTPTTSAQTAVASGVYTTGAITVGAIPSNYIVPSGTKEITKNGTYDIASFASAKVNVAGSGGGGYEGDYYSYGTATAKPGSGATSAQFTDIPKQPDFFICYVDTFNVESYHRAGVVVYDGETVYGQEIYSGTDDCYLRENANDASSYYYKFSYSGTTLTLSSAGTNNGGYFHNPGTYTLIYAYKDNENGTVAIDKKKVTAVGGASLAFDEMEGDPVWYSAILKANQDAQAASSSTVMYVNENGCTRMGNASSRAPYTFTAATGLGTYADGTLTLTPGSAEFAAKEYTLIYAYVPSSSGGETSGTSFPNGTEWTQSNITNEAGYEVYNANGIWVATGTDYLFYSYDGKNWAQCECEAQIYNSVRYGNGIWVASSSAGIFYSFDGIHWNMSNAPVRIWTNAAFYNGLWVVSGGTGAVYSEDGINWTPCSGISGQIMSEAKYANGLWVSGSSRKKLYYSEDGKVWIQCTEMPTSCPAVYNADGLWVAGTSEGIFYSESGKLWTQSSFVDDAITFVYNGRGLWVASGESGIYYSEDGKIWNPCSGASGFFNFVYYSNGIWLSGSTNGLYYSFDGINWERSNVTSGDFYSLHNANGIWVAGDLNGSGFYYSVTWEPPESY